MSHTYFTITVTIVTVVICRALAVNGGSWGQWSPCSNTCAGGTQTRLYFCTNRYPIPCIALHSQTRSCSQDNGGCWGQWSPCSNTCAGGTQTRLYYCTNRPPIPCIDLHSQRRSCSQANGGWSYYGEWGLCSSTCAPGIRIRTRTCIHHRPSCGNASCRGSNIQIGRCNTHSINVTAMAQRFARAVMHNPVTRSSSICRTKPFICNAQVPCTPPPPVCTAGCTYGDRDFLFIVDSSGSIGEDNYNAAKPDLALIATILCGNLGLDKQVAVMQFSNAAHKEIAFDQYDDPMDLFLGILGMTWLQASTRTWEAFDFARETMFTSANGHRPWAKKQALIVTDGKSTNAPAARELSIVAAQALKVTGVELFALWIGDPDDPDLQEIRHYVSYPTIDHVFSVGSVMSLEQLTYAALLIHDLICQC